MYHRWDYFKARESKHSIIICQTLQILTLTPTILLNQQIQYPAECLQTSPRPRLYEVGFMTSGANSEKFWTVIRMRSLSYIPNLRALTQVLNLLLTHNWKKFRPYRLYDHEDVVSPLSFVEFLLVAQVEESGLRVVHDLGGIGDDILDEYAHVYRCFMRGCAIGK